MKHHINFLTKVYATATSSYLLHEIALVQTTAMFCTFKFPVLSPTYCCSLRDTDSSHGHTCTLTAKQYDPRRWASEPAPSVAQERAACLHDASCQLQG